MFSSKEVQRGFSKNNFFGFNKWKKEVSHYIKYVPIINNDEIIIRTNNVIKMKGKYVLILDSNKGMYLKKDDVLKYADDIGNEGYLVKLNRNSFNSYEFDKNITECHINAIVNSYDDLWVIAVMQEYEDLLIKVIN